jgi:putative ABC transport system permease protein
MYKLAFRNLFTKKSRTALALVGLIIGVVTIISLVSITEGIKYLVSETVGEMSGVMIVEEGAFGAPWSELSVGHKDDIKGIPGVRLIAPRVMKVAERIEGGGAFLAGSMGMTMIVGLDPATESMKKMGPLHLKADIIKGRALQPTDTKAVVIGKMIADDYDKTVGSKIDIEDEDFLVVGIYDTGSPFTNGQILMPINEAQDIFDLDSDTVSAFFVEIYNPNQADSIARRIEFKLDDVVAMSTASFGEQIGAMLANVDAFLWAVSIASAIVAGIGIINTMLMSVMERTKEFGVLRSVGWTRDDLMKLIILESSFLGIGGGLIGGLIGVLIVEVAKEAVGTPMYVTPMLFTQAFIFAVAMGIIGGLYPAWRASKLEPIQALRGKVME